MLNIFGFKISKTAIKILIVSLSAALGTLIYSILAWLMGLEAYNIALKIGIRLLVIGVIIAATYDIIRKKEE